MDGADDRVLLLGADGMLGRAWERFLVERGIPHDAMARGRPAPLSLDLTDAVSVDRTVARGYRWVVNCVAYTAVDAAESDEVNARRVNADAVGELAKSTANHGAGLIHYSTDYVFDGTSRTPYQVSHPIAPVNAYGRTKAAGEACVRDATSRHLLIRTSWVYGPWGKNFVLTMRRLLDSQSRVSVVDDQRGRPTSVFTLVDATWALMQLGAFGTFHVTDAGECTWFELASEIARVIGSSCEVVPCSTDQFPRPAQRPAYSVLDIEDTQARIGPLRDWRSALRDTLAWPGN